MSWFDILTKPLADLGPHIGWWIKRGFEKVPELCQDGKVALRAGVNQTILLDLETGEFTNLLICE